MSKAPLKARLPRGFADRPASDLAGLRGMLDAIRHTFELYGFEALETPFVEYTEALGKFLPDLERPNEGVFSFQDDDESWLSLRYDLTAPLARHVAERLDAQSLTLPYRSYREGWVFRNEKPGPGRFRQFMQFDADTVGTGSIAADAEACMLMADTLEAVGIPRGQYVVKVNNRKVLDGVLEAIGLGGEENAGRRLTVLRAIDKYDRIGIDGVRDLLGAGRKDESGDVTRGAGLDQESIERLVIFLGVQASIALEAVTCPIQGGARRTGLDRFRAEGGGPESYFVESTEATINALKVYFGDSMTASEGIFDLEEISRLCVSAGYDRDRIRIDPSVVRGLEYYTGPVFEAELTFPVVNDEGQTVRFGSVAGGGRYDGLVGRFRPEPVPATGFSIGVSRLFAALQIVKSPIVAAAQAAKPVVVLVMDRERIGDYQALVAQLRRAKIPAELYLGMAGMKAQMKYADRRGAPLVVIQGSQEKERGEVQLKDLRLGTAASAGTSATNAEYRAARLAQVAVPEHDLVTAIREMLARPGQ